MLPIQMARAYESLSSFRKHKRDSHSSSLLQSRALCGLVFYGKPDSSGLLTSNKQKLNKLVRSSDTQVGRGLCILRLSSISKVCVMAKSNNFQEATQWRF